MLIIIVVSCSENLMFGEEMGFTVCTCCDKITQQSPSRKIKQCFFFTIQQPYGPASAIKLSMLESLTLINTDVELHYQAIATVYICLGCLQYCQTCL